MPNFRFSFADNSEVFRQQRAQLSPILSRTAEESFAGGFEFGKGFKIAVIEHLPLKEFP